jgi:hypothetical protein
VKTGQSTTSFHPATGNPIMTSSTYNRSVAHATDESKTVSSNESHGEVPDSKGGMPMGKPGVNRGRGNKGGHKGLVVRLLLALNDLLPVSIRPIKSKRAHRRTYLGIRHRIFIFRMHWRSHNKNKLKKILRLK